MEVAVSELRAHLSAWIDRAKSGTEVLVTERGVVVARLTNVETQNTLDRLFAEGHIARPERSGARPVAAGRTRPRSTGSLSAIVSDQRR